MVDPGGAGREGLEKNSEKNLTLGVRRYSIHTMSKDRMIRVQQHLPKSLIEETKRHGLQVHIKTWAECVRTALREWVAKGKEKQP